jgi:transcriptional regulator with XRE-family HTH domain
MEPIKLDSVTVDDLARLVGERLRAARRERGLSLGALAEAAGIGKGSLSEIENGARNPTLSTLYALAGTLGVPLATLLADRAGARISSPGIEARLLDVSRDDGAIVEVYRLRLDPGTRHRSAGHGPGVIEHLLVTGGRARVGRVGQETEIGPGEAARWLSDTVHGYTAVGTEPVTSVLVIRSPTA